MSAGFVVDLGRCVGCGSCVLACRLENDRPHGAAWRRVLSLNLDRYCGGPTYHFSLACHHCARPACRAACPAGVYEKRADGVVMLRQERCIGCRYCEMACPFGAPTFDSTAGVMAKCHLCAHRLDLGLSPACVSACPTGALLLFDDLDSGKTDGRTLEFQTIPGFADVGDCQPQIRFVPPRGRLRSRHLGELKQVLGK